MDELKDNIIKKKIDFYITNNTKVHVTKNNKFFYNGEFISEISKGIYKFRDIKLGEIDIFVDEILDISVYNEIGGPK